MLHAALLATALSGDAGASRPAQRTAIQRCFGAMDGAVYAGDPSDRPLMKANVDACERALSQIAALHASSARGPEKLFLTARILERAATLSYMGLDDAPTALREVRKASLYFRIAAGLPGQDTTYHEAAALNAQLTQIQLRTLHADLASRASAHDAVVALGTRRVHHTQAAGPAYTAYRKP